MYARTFDAEAGIPPQELLPIGYEYPLNDQDYEDMQITDYTDEGKWEYPSLHKTLSWAHGDIKLAHMISPWGHIYWPASLMINQ